jgi:hypothetical protein
MRICAVGALRDRTWAGKHVYDSSLTPFAQAVVGQAAQPYIVCYTDSDDVAPVLGKAEFYDSRNRVLQLTVEIGIASSVQEPAGSSTPPTGPLVIKFAATDSGMEFACDVMESQVIAALWGDPYSQWGDIFKRIAGKVIRMQRRRGGQGERGVKFAARRISFSCNPGIFDLAPGVRPDDVNPIWEFMQLARASPTIGQVDVPPILDDYIAVASAPNWRVAQAYLGLDSEGVREALVVDDTPLPWPGREEPPLSGFEVETVPGLERVTIAQDEDGQLVEVSPIPDTDEPEQRDWWEFDSPDITGTAPKP